MPDFDKSPFDPLDEFEIKQSQERQTMKALQVKTFNDNSIQGSTEFPSELNTSRF